MMPLLSLNVPLNNLILTVGLVAAVILLRLVLARGLRRINIKSMDLRRRWMIQIRNLCFAILILGVVGCLPALLSNRLRNNGDLFEILHVKYDLEGAGTHLFHS